MKKFIENAIESESEILSSLILLLLFSLICETKAYEEIITSGQCFVYTSFIETLTSLNQTFQYKNHFIPHIYLKRTNWSK